MNGPRHHADYSQFEPDDIELRRRKALQENPHGLTFEQAMEAFAAYFSSDGKAELQWLIDREYARDFHGEVPRLSEVGQDAYRRYEHLAEQKRLACLPGFELPLQPVSRFEPV